MELTKKKIYEDIEEIRETIECSKRKFSGPYKLFLGYGILQAALLGFNVIGMVIWGANNETAYFNFAVGMIGAMITATLYFLLYRMEKKSSNRYYLVAISTWGIIAIAMPFLLFAARIAIMVRGQGAAVETLQTLEEYKMLVSILLVCVAMIMVGYITDKMSLLVTAVIVLLCFIVLRVLPESSFLISVKENVTLEITFSALFYYIANIFGYIGLGMLLKYQEKKYGNI